MVDERRRPVILDYGRRRGRDASGSGTSMTRRSVLESTTSSGFQGISGLRGDRYVEVDAFDVEPAYEIVRGTGAR